MGMVKSFRPVQLFTGLVYSDRDIAEQTIAWLEKTYSAIDSRTEPSAFSQTTYYDREMGTPLSRQFVSFTSLIEADGLPDIKIATNLWEKDHTRQGGGRRINLDPGFLSEANVIVATTKNHYHRIPLRDGIYAHMEYVFYKGVLRVLEWTYPDFCSAAYMEFFTHLQHLYRKKLRESIGPVNSLR